VNSPWRRATEILAGVLASLMLVWLGCQQAVQNKIQDRQSHQQDTMREIQGRIQAHERELDRRSRHLLAAQARLDDFERESHTLDIRMVRIEMKLDQLLLGSNIRQPRNLPPMPDSQE